MLYLRRTAARTLALGLALAAGLATLAPGAALGKPKPKAAPVVVEDAGPSPEIEALRKKLAGTEDEAVAALDSIAEAGDPETVPLVKEVLARGGTARVLEAALKAAGKLKAEALSGVTAPYVQHRAQDVRRAAVRALLKTRGPIAVSTLRKALRSPDAAVRGTAATGLGSLGAREAMEDLFRAFDHGVAEAGAAIGQLCLPEECEQLAERTGKVAFDVMVTGFDQILFRPAADIPDEAKLRLVGRMREIGTPEVAKYLADVGERWPKDWSKKVKQAIDSAARAAGGGGK